MDDFNRYVLDTPKIGRPSKYPPVKTGNRYGYWLVIDDTPVKVGKDFKIYAKCRCTCNRICYVRTHDLKRGNSRGCGCSHSRNGLLKIGTKFNYWTILDFSRIINGNRYMKVQCDCGYVSEIRFSDLKRGKSKSCGCYRNQLLSDSRIGKKAVEVDGQLLPAWSERVKAIFKKNGIQPIK